MRYLRFFVVIIIIASLLILLFSCTSEQDGSIPELVTEESGEAEGEAFPERPEGYPTFCGSFVQPGLLANHSPERIEQHLRYMREVGIDILILQWSFITEGDKVTTVYYEDSFDQAKKASSFTDESSKLLENILSAAEKLDMKVFVGLNDNSEWWQKHVIDIKWIQRQVDLGIEGAKQIYDTYKEKYPNALHGWYFVFEFWNMKMSSTQIYNSAYLLDAYRDRLARIDSEMPFMLSPFINSTYTTAVEAGDMWERIFKDVDFLEGDIFCPQDSVGAEFMPLETMGDYFREYKRVVDGKEGLLLWANNEAFVNQSWSTASLHRIKRQLEITSDYASAHVTFAYSHHLNPDADKTGFHLAYKTYFETGEIPETVLSAPKFMHFLHDDNTIEFKGTINNSSMQACRVMFEKNGRLLTYADLESKYGTASIELSFTDTHVEGDSLVKYEIYLVDYYGNESPRFTFEHEFKSRTGENIAVGKKYTTKKPAENAYEDVSYSLTNGMFGKATYADNEWAGYLGSAEFVIDLGAVRDNIFAFSVNTLGGGSAGILAPPYIEIQISEDGESFKPLVSKGFLADKNEGVNKVVPRSFLLDDNVSARYVKFTITTSSAWIFIDEITVIAERTD